MKEIFIALLGKPYGVVIFQLLDATQFTIYLSLIALIGGGIVGMGITLSRVVPKPLWNKVGIAYTWTFQSTPLLMLLFLLGLGIPRLFGADINPWTAASIALVLYASAYLSDVWRGAIEALPIGQWEGGKALGFTFLQSVRLIILPQAFKLSLAPTVGFMVQIIKGTSLAYIIGFHDLMSIGKRWANAPVTGTEPFIIFPIMALIYFSLCFPLSRLAKWLETRLGTVDQRGGPELA